MVDGLFVSKIYLKVDGKIIDFIFKVYESFERKNNLKDNLPTKLNILFLVSKNNNKIDIGGHEQRT
jgi:hypothetical protein